jgi:hypothetical protein
MGSGSRKHIIFRDPRPIIQRDRAHRPRDASAPAGRVRLSLNAPARNAEWAVYAKRPFAGPAQGPRPCRAIYPPHRRPTTGWRLWTTARSASAQRTSLADIRRFLIHVLPDGLHRVRLPNGRPEWGFGCCAPIARRRRRRRNTGRFRNTGQVRICARRWSRARLPKPTK